MRRVESRVESRCRGLIAVASVLVVLSCLSSPARSQVYGTGVDLEVATPIHEILGDPDAVLGQTVRVEGQVLDVCPRKGCWIQIGDEASSIQIKVEDDVIVFPSDAKGRIAAAQGEVEAIEMSREEYLRWLAHAAEERGESFDPDAAAIGSGPYRVIRIRGAGARIE